MCNTLKVFVFASTQDVGYPEFLNIRPYMSQSTGDPVMYGLYAVLVHSGYSCHAGHYYCYVKVRQFCPQIAFLQIALQITIEDCVLIPIALCFPRPVMGSGIR